MSTPGSPGLIRIYIWGIPVLIGGLSGSIRDYTCMLSVGTLWLIRRYVTAWPKTAKYCEIIRDCPGDWSVGDSAYNPGLVRGGLTGALAS